MSSATVRRQSPGARSDFARRHAADLAFAGVLVLTGVLVMLEMRGLSFFADEWDFLLNRPGLSAHSLLTPHGPHLVLLPILVYKVLLAVFGGNSYVPFRVLTAVDLMLMVATVGLLTRRLWGPWWALAPMAMIACLGPGGASTLSPFQVCYTLAVVPGVLCLVALSDTGRRRDLLACGSLIVSLASCSQGVGFIVGAAVMIAIRRQWPRWWTVCGPAALYALWYLTYGHQHSETQLSLWTTSLQYTVNGASSTIAGVFALSGVAANGLLDPTLGVPLLFGGVAVLCVALARGWVPRPLFCGLAATFLVLWVLSSLSNTPQLPRYYNDPRYLSTDGLLLLAGLVACIPQPRLPRAATWLTGILVVIIAATNLSQYAPAHHSLYQAEVVTRAETGSLLVMRGVVAPGFSPTFPGDPGVSYPIQAGPFLRAWAAHGIVSDSVAELQAQDATTRKIVDGVLVRGELHGLGPASVTRGLATAAPPLTAGHTRVAHGCRVLGSTSATVELSPGTYRLRAGGVAALSVTIGRFAAPSVSLGQIAAGGSASLAVPVDHAPGVTWHLAMSGQAGAICRVTGAR